MLAVKTVEDVSGGGGLGGDIDVHMLGTGGEGAHDVGEVLEGSSRGGAPR
jgi:hypothetical protein